MKYTVIFAPQGSYTALKWHGRPPVHSSVARKRGEVQGFSYRSRSRLLERLSKVKRDVLPVFVTLTYPEQFPLEWEVYKYHVHKFLIYLSRQFGSFVSDAKGCKRWRSSVSAIWKLEFQERGAAHFHLLVWGVAVAELGNFIPECWYKIVNSGDENHLLWHKGLLGNGNQHCVQPVRSWHGVKSYASKYLSKLDERTERSGRFWGVRGKLPMSILFTFKVDIRQALEFRRHVSNHCQYPMFRLGFWISYYHQDYFRLVTYIMQNFSNDPPPPEVLPFRHLLDLNRDKW